VKNRTKLARNLLSLLGLLGASIVVYSCGIGSGSPNQGLPTGTVVAQGSLTPSSCLGATPTTVTGTVVLVDQSNGKYAVNISGISFAGGNCSALTVEVLANTYYMGAPIVQFTGSQNFYFTTPSVPTQVIFHCNSGQAAPVDDCAVANLTPI
jgi:hypothetical protein